MRDRDATARRVFRDRVKMYSLSSPARTSRNEARGKVRLAAGCSQSVPVRYDGDDEQRGDSAPGTSCVLDCGDE